MTTTDCQRYEQLMAWVIGPASDPAASDEDREFSDEDIEWMLCHQDLCKNPEHSTANWRETLERCDQRLAERFMNALEDLKRQERGVLTPDSPHHWAIEALKKAGLLTPRTLRTLPGCTFVFTYNMAVDPAHSEQCGQVAGTIVSAAVNAFPQGENINEVLHLTTSELRLHVRHEGQMHLVRVAGLQIQSVESDGDQKAKQWRLVVTYPDLIPGHYYGISGTLVIFPNNREK